MKTKSLLMTFTIAATTIVVGCKKKTVDKVPVLEIVVKKDQKEVKVPYDVEKEEFKQVTDDVVKKESNHIGKDEEEFPLSKDAVKADYKQTPISENIAKKEWKEVFTHSNSLINGFPSFKNSIELVLFSDIDDFVDAHLTSRDGKRETINGIALEKGENKVIIDGFQNVSAGMYHFSISSKNVEIKGFIYKI